jgi:putative photosynthetic complex assembly protein 2
VYVAFASGLALWALPTTAFYLGYIAGPRVEPLSPSTVGLARFREATSSVLYHEFACLAGALAAVALTWDGGNRIGLWTYLILWWMHLSGKLNMYLGVANLAEPFMPPHLAYLTSYMRQRPMNLLFPVSVTVSTALTGILLALASGAPPGSSDQIGAAILATLMALAVLEHWFLVLPFDGMALWRWSLRSRQSAAPGSLLFKPSSLQPARNSETT